MEYPWNILGLENTRDKKTIKHAYARLLRLNKPDEDPDGFRSVNDAYQYALNLLKQDRLYDDVTLPQIDNEAINEEHAVPYNDYGEYNETNDSETRFHMHVETEKSSLYTEVLRLIEHKNYSLESWRFMSSHPGLLLDGIFLEQISYTIFQTLLYEMQHDRVFLQQTKPDREKSIFDVLVLDLKYSVKKTFLDRHKKLFLYFNSIFDWTANWQKLEDQFSDVAMLVIKELEIAQNNQDSYLDRWALKQLSSNKEMADAYDSISHIKESFLRKFNAQKGTRRHFFLEVVLVFLSLTLFIVITSVLMNVFL